MRPAGDASEWILATVAVANKYEASVPPKERRRSKAVLPVLKIFFQNNNLLGFSEIRRFASKNLRVSFPTPIFHRF
jgi:hypothetical protein